ncbi:MAG TPA: hypothetical protein VFN87_12475 [Solirubrobacteraceae bacterium]|nr:hypothetical protein [Solirubrobacteraceae bacterium]
MDRTGTETDRDRHARAVARTLEFADEAALRRDYTDALAWLQTLEAIGHELSDAYLAKRASWQLARESNPGPDQTGLR